MKDWKDHTDQFGRITVWCERAKGRLKKWEEKGWFAVGNDKISRHYRQFHASEQELALVEEDDYYIFTKDANLILSYNRRKTKENLWRIITVANNIDIETVRETTDDQLAESFRRLKYDVAQYLRKL